MSDEGERDERDRGRKGGRKEGRGGGGVGEEGSCHFAFSLLES